MHSGICYIVTCIKRVSDWDSGSKTTIIVQAIETFKDCGKKDNKMAGMASTNLSFILFLVSAHQSSMLVVVYCTQPLA